MGAMMRAEIEDWVLAKLRKMSAAVREASASPARLLTDQDRLDIEAEIHVSSQLTSGYGFMLFAACGIAALGLLQSSVAVVIGAMLISPLMGPILSMGIALARVEPREFKRAATTLAIGALLSVLASTLIVWVSPLKDVTPEILARTRPTLMDLAVALLSGFVGAYLSINRKLGAIAGVAIATALMPPLAVIGYGLATSSWAFAGGALLLFLTNVVAILGSVFGVARRYGFAPKLRRGPAWEVFALFAVTILLCVPLALSLQNIVLEARETNRVRGAIERAFKGASPHINDLSVVTDRGKAADVQCVVVTQKYVPGAAAEIAKALMPGARISVEQVVTASGAPRQELAASALGNRPTAGLSAADLSPDQRLRLMLGGAGQIAGLQKDGANLNVNYVLNGTPSLADYQAAEQAARRFLPDTHIRIIPPLTDLPDILFPYGSTRLDAAAQARIEKVSWALERWGMRSVRAEGFATAGRKGPRAADDKLAARRAQVVADALKALGNVSVQQTSQVVDGRPRAAPNALAVRLSVAPNPSADRQP